LLVSIVDYADFGGANLVVDPKFPKSRVSDLLKTANTKKDSQGYLLSPDLFGTAWR
jgi:hypothetical protein